MSGLVLSFFLASSCFDVCRLAEHTWIYFLALFCFTIYSLHLCGSGVFLFVIFCYSQCILLQARGVFVCDFLLFTIYILAGQERFCLWPFFMNSLSLYWGVISKFVGLLGYFKFDGRFYP